MSNQIIEAKVLPAVDDKLIKYANQTELAPAVSTTLAEAFRPVFIKAAMALAEAVGVATSVKDATCVTEIRKSRACRLAIRAVRIEGEAVHKKQKEAALRFGRAVDGFRNILLADLTPVEQALQAAEDTAERAEAPRKAALKTSRTAELMPLLDGPAREKAEAERKRFEAERAEERRRTDAELARIAEVARIEREAAAADSLAHRESAKNVMNTPRDGVITANGLTAEFRFIRLHPSPDCPVSHVDTASGEAWVLNEFLTYDPAPVIEQATFQGVLGKLVDKTI